jgi:hypothetical protein
MLANLRALFGVVVDIVLLRRGPEHLPASPLLLAVVVALYAGITGLVSTSVRTPDPQWPMMVALVICVKLAWYRVALQMSEKSERFVQTMNALFAVRALFTPLVLPISSILFAQAQAKQPPSTTLSMMLLALIIWWFVVSVRIVRSAFDWSWPPAVIMVLAQEFALLLAAAALLGPAQPPG